MGDNTNANSSDNGTEEVTPLTVSALFDETHRKYLRLVRGEDDEDTCSDSVQNKITELIRSVEDLTRQVSVLGILSDNEDYREMNPSELKFILLPFMLGTLWQMNCRGESRGSVCELSKVYFRDYLKRCFNYEIITKLPPEMEDDEEEEKEEVDEKGKKKAKAKAPAMNSDDVRSMKILRFKEGKMLDERIGLYLSRHLNGESIDDEDLRRFVISLLKRNCLEAEDQLRSISQESALLLFAEQMNISGECPTSSSQPSSHRPPQHQPGFGRKSKDKKPPEIFILTKNQMEKQVFGAGYPAVPVMTVEELYEQRRKTGQWGPPSHGHNSNQPNPTETEDDRDADKEAQEERDDEELRERQRRMDEYKDEHRTGWGNRHNRS